MTSIEPWPRTVSRCSLGRRLARRNRASSAQPTRSGGSRTTRSSIRSFRNWFGLAMAVCAAKRSPTSRNATRASTCPIGGARFVEDGRNINVQGAPCFALGRATARPTTRRTIHRCRRCSAGGRCSTPRNASTAAPGASRLSDRCAARSPRRSRTTSLGRCNLLRRVRERLPRQNAITFTLGLAACPHRTGAGLMATGDHPVHVAAASRELRRLLGRSLRLREISRGGLQRLRSRGQRARQCRLRLPAASDRIRRPRRGSADGILVTGPLTEKHERGDTANLRSRRPTQAGHRRRCLRRNIGRSLFRGPQGGVRWN